MASILLGEEERSEDEDEMGRYSASDSDDYGGGADAFGGTAAIPDSLKGKFELPCPVSNRVS